VTDEEKILALMQADRWIEKVRSQREHLVESAELTEVENELRTLASRLGAIETQRRPTKGSFDEAVDRAHTLRERRRELEGRLQSATVPARELTAMHQELEHLTKILNDAEDREVELLLELEPLDDAVQQVKGHAQPLAQRRADLKVAVEQLQSSLDDEVVHLRETRIQLASEVPGPLLAHYEAALARGGTSGAALLVDGRCDGCRIALAPLDRDRFRSMTSGKFFDCPECGRILLTC
jgi:predicted  nucleic acid-binding Zn-ribbon protein